MTPTVILWGDKVNSLVPKHSYIFHRIQVNAFNGINQLQLPRSGSTVKHFDQLVIPQYSDDESPDNFNKANNVTIIGVQNFDVLYSCINCKTNMERTGSNMILCHSCNTVQNLWTPK